MAALTDCLVTLCCVRAISHDCQEGGRPERASWLRHRLHPDRSLSGVGDEQGSS